MLIHILSNERHIFWVTFKGNAKIYVHSNVIVVIKSGSCGFTVYLSYLDEDVNEMI